MFDQYVSKSFHFSAGRRGSGGNSLLDVSVPYPVLNLVGMVYRWKVLREGAEKYMENLAICDRRAAL